MRIELFERGSNKPDPDLPARAGLLANLNRVLDGSLYDVIDVPFDQEYSGSDQQYIKIRDRRPSVQYGLCRCVVDDAVSILFSEAHFPQVQCDDEKAAALLKALIQEAGIDQKFIDAATKGSVGSVAIHVMVTRSNRIHLKVMQTTFLTPTWDPEEPEKLLKVTEKYKVPAKALKDIGYSVESASPNDMFWFQREWDNQAETWFLPWPVKGDQPAKPTIDKTEGRTTQHNLGLVPMVWIKNLPGGDEIDGACTFTGAIKNGIEIDYQLSQLGRGLKYSQDPLLMLKEPAGEGVPFVRSASNAIKIDPSGDAKLLEISGSASEAVIKYVEKLRELAIETIHGNRANADKLSAAQSGRALEMLYQALIWLADCMRLTYGKCGLIVLLQMIMEISRTRPLQIGKEKAVKFSEDLEISLKWPPYISPSEQDQLSTMQAMQVGVSAKIISRSTATRHVSGMLDIEDAEAEAQLIKDERAADIAEQPDPEEEELQPTIPHEKIL